MATTDMRKSIRYSAASKGWALCAAKNAGAHFGSTRSEMRANDGMITLCVVRYGGIAGNDYDMPIEWATHYYDPVRGAFFHGHYFEDIAEAAADYAKRT